MSFRSFFRCSFASRLTLRTAIRACVERGIGYLTLFAFSTENWRRPAEEVSILMDLFVRALDQEVARLHENGVRFRVIGNPKWSTRLQPGEIQARGLCGSAILEAVAEMLHGKAVLFLRRIHRPPRLEKLKALAEFEASQNYVQRGVMIGLKGQLMMRMPLMYREPSTRSALCAASRNIGMSSGLCDMSQSISKINS